MNEPKLYTTKKYKDNRGFFKESRPNDIIVNLKCNFVQENLSFSKKGTIRGMHYQWLPAMGKLVSVVSGSIMDIIVDIRESSPNLGKVYYYNLSSDKGDMLWVPQVLLTALKRWRIHMYNTDVLLYTILKTKGQ